MSTTVTIRMSDDERSLLEKYAKLYGCPISTFIKERIDISTTS